MQKLWKGTLIIIFVTFLNTEIQANISYSVAFPIFLNNATHIPPDIPPPPFVTFVETFDGDPIEPTSWNPDNWDVTVHSRDRDTWYTLLDMQAAHGPACEGPPMTHLINTYEQSVYNCRNHMMTAINAVGYGVIYLTPNHVVDFSERTAVIQFDISTARNSFRDWIDIWVTPYEQNLQLPLEGFRPDLNGEPQNGIHIRLDLSRNSFRAFRIENHNAVEISGQHWVGYDDFFDPSPMRRDTFQIDLSSRHLIVGMPDYNLYWIDKDIEELDWTQAIVQFGHHSYNPNKSCNFDGTCGPNSWHWDSVIMKPALPFAIISADRRYVNEESTSAEFESPAPAFAHLRFAGIGEQLEVSFDGGNSWQTAQKQIQEEDNPGAFASYWMPIPIGVSQVEFRGESWFAGKWHVRDISIWAFENIVLNRTSE